MDDTLGITDIRNVRTPAEANAHLVYRASEVVGTLNVPDSQWDERKYKFEKQMYRDSAKVLVRTRGLSSDVSDACDKVIEQFEHLKFGVTA